MRGEHDGIAMRPAGPAAFGSVQQDDRRKRAIAGGPIGRPAFRQKPPDNRQHQRSPTVSPKWATSVSNGRERHPAHSDLNPAKPASPGHDENDPLLLPQVHHDLPERPRCEMIKGFWCIIKAVDDLNDWMDVSFFNEASQALERCPMSHGNALDARAAQH